MSEPLARQVVAIGSNAETIATELVDRLRAPGLRLALVYADWQLDSGTIARVTQRGLAPAPVIGGTTIGVIGPRPVATAAVEPGTDQRAAVALGLYGDWLRVGIGVAPALARGAMTRSRDAVQQAAQALGSSAQHLRSGRHFGITVLDGRSSHGEAFCIGSAATAPQIRMIGGGAATEVESKRSPNVWAHGEVIGDAGIVALLESELPCSAVSSAHLVPTDVKTVVTGASGYTITELDGRPAAPRLRELVAPLGNELAAPRPTGFAFARYLNSVPHVRAITHFDGNDVVLASCVEAGHVLRVMRAGDLIGSTRRDLATAAERVGGSMAALIAVSCVARHWEATACGLDRELAAVYGAYPTIGFQSFGEQSGTLLLNHTLTGLAIGARR